MAIWRVTLGILVIVASLTGAAYEWHRLTVDSTVRLLESTAAELVSRRDQPQARAFAREELQRVNALIGSVPNDPNLRMIAAVHYRTLNRYDEAVQEYEHALEISSRPEVLLNLGITHIENGDISRAVVIFARMFQFDPDFQTLTPPGPITNAALKLANAGMATPGSED